MANGEPRFMVAYFYGGEHLEDAAKHCIETAKLNNCQVFMDFNQVYIPVTRCMKPNDVTALYHLMLGWHPEKEPKKAGA
jgi:effector-binding domain-containing protein